MNITQNQIDDLNAVLTVEVKAEDYANDVNKQLKDYAKKANMPGFRPGKVPFGMVKKMYGNSLLADTLNKMLNKELNDYISTNEIDIVGSPLPKEGSVTNIDINNTTDLTFEYEIGIIPAFETKLTKREKFDLNKIVISDEVVNDYVNELRRRYGKLSNPEAAGDNDMVGGIFTELNEDGSVKEGGVTNNSTISLEFLEDKKVARTIIGLKKDDEITLDPATVSKGENDLAALLGISTDKLPEVSNKFNFKVTYIAHMEPADMNQEFFDKIFGEGTVASENEFKQKIKDDIEGTLKVDADRVFVREVQEKLKAKFDFELPETFLKRWLVESNEKLTIEQIDAEFDAYKTDLKWQVIENKLIKQYELKVEHTEVIEDLKQRLKAQYAQYGQYEVSEEEINKGVQQFLQNEEQLRNVYQQHYGVKLIEVYKDKTAINEVEINYNDFYKQVTGSEPQGSFFESYRTLGNFLR